MKILLTPFCFLLLLCNAQADCRSADIRIIYQSKAEISKEIVCDRMVGKIQFFVSKSCEEKSNGSCEILKRPKKDIVIKNYRSNFGSPGFKLCSALGGVPQIFDYKFNQDSVWKSTERCFFDKDFVEISLLTSEWKKFIKVKHD